MTEEEIRLEIESEGICYIPMVCSEMTVCRFRSKDGAKAQFSVVKDPYLSFQEGDRVRIRAGDEVVFVGYIFTKERNREGMILVTAYDQIRYLKNRATYVFTGMTATQMVEQIARDFQLETGKMEDSSYSIALRVEDEAPLAEIIYRAIQDTYDNTGRQFVLYDEGGKLCFEDTENLVAAYELTNETAQDIRYRSTIDKDTYNQVKLRKRGKKGSVTEYVEKDEVTIDRWGLLQLTGTVQEEENGQEKARALLLSHNRVNRSLVVQGAFGDWKIRGGSIITVNLQETGDILIHQAMMVEWVRHTVGAMGHTMELCLRGGWINDEE